jgi:hypothetical protein
MTSPRRTPPKEVKPEEIRGIVLAVAITAGSYSVYRDIMNHSGPDEPGPGVVSTRALFTGLIAGLATLVTAPVLKSVLLMSDQSEAIQEQVMISNQAVEAVEGAIQEMDTSTTRMQKFAIAISVGTALIGAVLGGFAGAWAAVLIGR